MFTITSLESLAAVARVVSNPVQTGPVVAAMRRAIIDVVLTERAVETERTGAVEPVDAIRTVRAVLARIRAALVDVNGTVRSREAERARAGVVIDAVETDFVAGATDVGAFVNVGRAVDAAEARYARAVVRVAGQLVARGVVLTGAGVTAVQFASGGGERWLDSAHEQQTPGIYVFDVTSIGQRSSPWTCNSVKVETNFTSSASSIFLVHNLYCDKCI